MLEVIEKVTLKTICLFVFLVVAVLLPLEELAGEDFESWRQDFRETALKQGISETVLDRYLSEIRFDPVVIERLDSQAEFTMPFEEYKSRFVNEEMIGRGSERYDQMADTLVEIHNEFGVHPTYLLAIWGVESRFGGYESEFEIVPSLATLAYAHPRSSDFFKRELLTLFELYEELGFSLEGRPSSWAGAMGQPQFLPSSYQHYAVDFTATGWADIWGCETDILASVANYLSEHGWQTGEGCGKFIEPDEEVSEQKRVVPLGKASEIRYAATSNFDAIFSYNRANNYVVTVCRLAEEIREKINDK